MTRRVSEPSQEQKALQGRWGVEDLRRRPAPLVEAAAGDIPYTVGKIIENAYDFGDGMTNITWDVVVNPYPAVFEHVSFGGGFYWKIKVLEDGLYSYSGHLPIDTNALPLPDYVISVYSVDPTGAQRHHRAYPQTVHNIWGGGDLVDAGGTWDGIWRLAADEEIEFQLYNPNATDDVLTTTALGWGTYIEMRKLGSATMTGRSRDDDPG